MVIDKITDSFILLGLLAIATGVHLLGHITAALLVRVKIEKVTLFYGRTIFKFKTPAFAIEIGMLPYGGSVKFSDKIQNRSLLTNWFVTINGPLFLIISSVILLNYDKSLLALASGFGQIIRGAISPLTYGETLIQRFFGEYVSSSIFAAYGIIAAKLAAFNLLPLLYLNGGQLFIALFPWLRDSKWGFRIGLISTFVVFAIYGSWIVAFIAYLLRS